MNKEFEGYKAICKCGHTGSGPGSQHNDVAEPGIGSCREKSCSCTVFRWDRWTKKYTNYQAALKRNTKDTANPSAEEVAV